MTLECETAKPDQKVDWFRNGKKIPKSDKRASISVDGTKHKLTLKEAKLDDAADYSAKVGDEATSAKLDVKGQFCRVWMDAVNISLLPLGYHSWLN